MLRTIGYENVGQWWLLWHQHEGQTNAVWLENVKNQAVVKGFTAEQLSSLDRGCTFAWISPYRQF